MIYRIDVEAVTPVNPTEDPERVAAAVEAVFPDADIDHGTGELVARTHSIDRLGELLAKQRIRETARTTLLAGVEGDTIAFTLSKQAAYVGVVNFALEDPAELGDIAVRIRVEQPDPSRLVEWLTAPDGVEDPGS